MRFSIITTVTLLAATVSSGLVIPRVERSSELAARDALVQDVVEAYLERRARVSSSPKKARVAAARPVRPAPKAGNMGNKKKYAKAVKAAKVQKASPKTSRRKVAAKVPGGKGKPARMISGKGVQSSTSQGKAKNRASGAPTAEDVNKFIGTLGIPPKDAGNSPPSSKFAFPQNPGTKLSPSFDVQLVTANLSPTEHFTNSAQNYFAAPQMLDKAGIIRGHKPEKIVMDNAMQAPVVDPTTFAFLRGSQISKKPEQGDLRDPPITLPGGIVIRPGPP